MSAVDEVSDLTRLLRNGTDPLWTRLRHLIAEQGIDVSTTALADSFEDDDEFEYGVIVTTDGRAIQFGLDYCDRTLAEAQLVEWSEEPASRAGSVRQVAAAREFLRLEREASHFANPS